MIKEDGLEKLKADLKSGAFERLYTLYGDEDYLKRFYLSELKTKLLDGGDEEFCYFQYDMQTFDLVSLCDNLESYPFCGGNKLIVLENLELSKIPEGDKRQLISRLGELAEFVTVVFYYDSIFLQVEYAVKLRRQGELRELSKLGLAVDVSIRGQGELSRWAARHFKAAKKKISPAAIQFLLSYTDNSMTNLKTEIDKLVCCPAEEITEREITELCSKSFEADIFDLTAAVADRKFPRALEVMGGLKERKTEPLEVLYGISAVFTEMLYVKTALEAGVFDAAKIVSDFKIKSSRKFLITRYLSKVRGEQESFLKEALRRCLALDGALKSSRNDRWFLLEQMLCELSALSD